MQIVGGWSDKPRPGGRCSPARADACVGPWPERCGRGGAALYPPGRIACEHRSWCFGSTGTRACVAAGAVAPPCVPSSVRLRSGPYPAQPRHSHLLNSSVPAGQTREGGIGGSHAQVAPDPQRGIPGLCLLATDSCASGHRGLTSNPVAEQSP